MNILANITTTTERKPTVDSVAAEICRVRTGFGALRALLHNLRVEEISAEAISHLVWTADRVGADLDDAYCHAEALADDEFAAVTAMLQAAE